MLRTCCLATLLVLAMNAEAEEATKPKPDGNRLAYLDEPLNPYYPHKDFPKLITPQWVGEEGVECVVTLGIDDMRDPKKYEAYLRPILDRLKKIDGRAPVSIMTCQVKPDDPQLAAWLKEGLSIECHTFDHPCPCLKESSLAKAKETYDKCLDLISQIPGNKPVAFRMPCCDSLNTPSPRFWAEVFNKTTAKGNFLQIDSSVFNIITGKDESLPKEIRFNDAGEERFRRYVPFKDFVNTIEDYPYPYIIGRMCWEFPCVVPSDWSAQHVQKPNNPDTVRDWKLALDAIVQKQGVFNLVFHPHGWIRPEQIVELIDYAVEKHGKKVKFLTFGECAERLNKNLLEDQEIRDQRGVDGIARVVDLDDDGYMDVMLFQGTSVRTLLSIDRGRRRREIPFAIDKQPMPTSGEHIRFGAWANRVYLLTETALYDFQTGVGEPHWLSVSTARPRVPEEVTKSVRTSIVQDLDSACTILITKPTADRLLEIQVFDDHSTKSGGFTSRPTNAPRITSINALRLVDVNADGMLDLLYSDPTRYFLYLHEPETRPFSNRGSWSIKVIDGVRGQAGGVGPEIPPFVRADGTNNGAFFHSKALWIINEDTARMPNHAFKLTFAEMLK